MAWTMKAGRRILAAAALALGGIANAEILITQVIPMTGPVARDGKEASIGAKVYFDALNAAGGVAKQKVRHVIIDDQYKPDETIRLMRKAAVDTTLAFILPIGSPSMTKVLKEQILEEVKIPVVGVIPGAETLRNPGSRYLFHVRAGDKAQIDRVVEQALTVGQKRLAVLHVEIPFGKAGLALVEQGLKQAGLEPVARATVPMGGADAADVRYVEIVRKAQPDMVVLLAPPSQGAQAIKTLRTAGLTVPITTLNYVDTDSVCKIAGEANAKGVSMVQVFPNVRNKTIPIVRDFNEHFKRHGPANTEPNYTNLEGYVTARVLVEGIRRAGATPTRESVLKALEGMSDVDLGGFRVNYSPTNHVASGFSEIGIISKSCKLIF
jgi:branched-chain amino acid transport system substrate-binding protein